VPVDYHIRFWKGEMVDFIISQQDAFDKVDQLCPIERQKYMLYQVLEITDSIMNFDSFEDVSAWFKKAINKMRQMNYSGFQSEEFRKYQKELKEIINEKVAS